MEIIEIIGILAIGCIISFIAIHFWVFICDCIVGGIKRIFGIKKKSRNWHTIDNNQKTRTDIAAKDSKTDINERLY